MAYGIPSKYYTNSVIYRYWVFLVCDLSIVIRGVIYKEIWVPIMMIEHTIFARSNTILSDQNTCLLSYTIMEEGLGKLLLDQNDCAIKFCPIICVFARSYDR